MSGAAPALVLLHAFGAAGRSFDPLRERLDGRVLAPDLPGFGGAPELAAPSVAAYADWVEAQVQGARLERAVLGGWSMGGKVAMAVAARRPPWLAGLLLVAPSPPSPEPMDEADRQAQVAGYGDAARARDAIVALVADPGAPWIAQAVQDRLRAGVDAWRWWLESGSREDLPLGDAADVPTTIVAGRDDPHLGPPTQARLTQPALAGSHLVELADCGHFVPLEQPDMLAAVIGDAGFQSLTGRRR